MSHSEKIAKNAEEIEKLKRRRFFKRSSKEESLKTLVKYLKKNHQLGKIVKKLGKDFKSFEKNLETFKQEIESQNALYSGLLESNLIEFDDQRYGIATIFELHGIPCDDISGWTKNNYIDPVKKVKKRFGWIRVIISKIKIKFKEWKSQYELQKKKRTTEKKSKK